VLQFITVGNRIRFMTVSPSGIVGGAAAVEQIGKPQLTRGQIAAVTAGNALEFYDFVTYAFFATQIGRALFPGDASSKLLLSLATFGVGFLSRPLGGLIIGRMADRRGRKPAMILSFTTMGAAMTGLALTPSYAVIGMAAPILAVIFRLLQGFALGGEVGPNIAYLLEAAPKNRRGLYIALNFASADFAALVAGLLGFGLSSLLTTTTSRLGAGALLSCSVRQLYLSAYASGGRLSKHSPTIRSRSMLPQAGVRRCSSRPLACSSSPEQRSATTRSIT
jgi:MFS family permease